MKSFKSNVWLLPQPVLIIGTYDKNGKPNAMNAAWVASGTITRLLSPLDLMQQRIILNTIRTSLSPSLLQTP